MCGLAALIGLLPAVLQARLLAALRRRGPDAGAAIDVAGLPAPARLLATVLHLRGATLAPQPLTEDAAPGGDALCWNGEVFGADAAVDDSLARVTDASESDTAAVFAALRAAADAADHATPAAATEAVRDCLQRLHGPWAVLFWHARTRTLFVARDPRGRRSLLVHLPVLDGHGAAAGPLMFTSVAFDGRCDLTCVADGAEVAAEAVFPFVELEPSGLYSLRCSDCAIDAQVLWRGSVSGGDGEMVLQHVPWRQPLWSLQGLAVTGREPDAPALPWPAILRVCSLELLRRLSRAVRTRVRLVADGVSGGGPAAGPAFTLTPADVVRWLTGPQVAEVVDSAGGDGGVGGGTGCSEPCGEDGGSGTPGEASAGRPPARERRKVRRAAAAAARAAAIAASHDEVGGDAAAASAPITVTALLDALLQHAEAGKAGDVAASGGAGRRLSGSDASAVELRTCAGVGDAVSLAAAGDAPGTAAAASSSVDMTDDVFSPPRGHEALAHALPTSAVAAVLASLAAGASGVAFAHEATQLQGAVIAVLFSGGLDSMLLAALAHHHAPPTAAIDLINVCFATDHASPDRVTATAGYHRLRHLYPTRTWQFIAVDEDFAAVQRMQAVVASLLAPRLSHMDFNIGSALWFAARGIGFVDVDVDGAAPTDAAASGGTTHVTLSAAVSPAVAAKMGLLYRSSVGSGLLPQLHAMIAGVEVATVSAAVHAYDDAPLGAAATSQHGAVLSAAVCQAVADARAAAAAAEDGTVSAATGSAIESTSAAGAGGGSLVAGHSPATAAPADAAVLAPEAPLAAASTPLPSGGTAAASATRRRRSLARVLVRSAAPVLLVGVGSDEQLVGYARHRTKYAHGGWARLRGEVDLDVSRLWLRNLGRDDRICSSHGRELRTPYLDECFTGFVRSLPLPVIADLSLPPGVGDKRLLRMVAAMLGLDTAATLAKRAIHFGSRIAKQSNVAAFGSNAAARGDADFVFHLGSGRGSLCARAADVDGDD